MNATVTTDPAVVAEANRISEAVFDDVDAAVGSELAVIAAAPAGAGKSHMITSHVTRLRKQGKRVAIATPTNEQAFSLLERLGRAAKGSYRVAHLPAAGTSAPAEVLALPSVDVVESKTWLGADLVIGTLNKLADARYRAKVTRPYDVLVIDEAYQADSARYYAAADLAATHLLVGDAGQLDPFTTIEDTSWWRGGFEDPLQTAVGVVSRAHPEKVRLHQMPASWRLDARAVPVAQAFYHRHTFSAVVPAGVRSVEFGRPQSTSPLDPVIEHAGTGGWAHLQLPGSSIQAADPVVARQIAELVLRIFERGAIVGCERESGRQLEAGDVAIGVSHNDQKDLLRSLLDDSGHREVIVETANRLQGLEFAITVVWHPLTGQLDADAFHLDPGRLCVLLTRHRHACVVVGRETDRRLLDGVPPATPAYAGVDGDVALDGWAAHERVFDRLQHDKFVLKS